MELQKNWCEVERLIESGQNEEAVALLKHIRGKIRRDKGAGGVLDEHLTDLIETLGGRSHLEAFKGNRMELSGTRDLAPGETTIPVWFATNRKPTGVFAYGGEAGGGVTFGQMDMHVPKRMRQGQQARKWYQRWLAGEFHQELVARKYQTNLDADEFWAGLSDASGEAAADGDSDALVYIHGFNVTFARAAKTAARMAWNLNIPGATAFYSWPSMGRVTSYFQDRNRLDGSKEYLRAFLRDFAAKSGASRVHVLAHSMGNHGLLESLNDLKADGETGETFKLGHLILAAPDVDRARFLERAGLYETFGERTTLYASPRDIAVFASAWINKVERVGFLPPVTTSKHIDAIHVSRFDVDLLGHGFFSDSRPVVNDMTRLLETNRALEDDSTFHKEIDPETGLPFYRFRAI